ncbi:MAG: hypothetical protein ACYC4Q_10800 [Victivallaceae bacterium]
MNLKAAISIFAVLVSFQLHSGEADSKSYADLDKNIVKAYNSNPRNTAEVYANSIIILEKASKEENTNGTAWQLKARKLITVSCFYECTQAIDKKLYKQAYIWAKRGEKNGTTFGKIGDVPVKNLYDYLTFASKELQETPMVKNSKPEELAMQSGSFKDVKIESSLKSVVLRGAILRTQLQAGPDFLMEGIGADLPVNVL